MLAGARGPYTVTRATGQRSKDAPSFEKSYLTQSLALDPRAKGLAVRRVVGQMVKPLRRAFSLEDTWTKRGSTSSRADCAQVSCSHAELQPSPNADPSGAENHQALLKDLGTEYYALLGVVSDFDKRDVVIKGWSVTLSLASLGVGFQQGHYALFGLAAATALGFWILDAQTKRHQMRYYARMRDIEVAASHINRLTLGQASFNRIITSSPLVDWTWGFPGKKGERDWRDDSPRRRTAANVRGNLRRAPIMAHVALPHLMAVVLGVLLLVGAIVGLPGLAQLNP